MRSTNSSKITEEFETQKVRFQVYTREGFKKTWSNDFPSEDFSVRKILFCEVIIIYIFNSILKLKNDKNDTNHTYNLRFVHVAVLHESKEHEFFIL